MAFTKSPEYNTHQTKFVPVEGMSSFRPLIDSEGPDYIYENALLIKREDRAAMIQRPRIVEDTAATTDYEAHYAAGIHGVRSLYYSKQVSDTTFSSTSSGSTGVVIEDDLWQYSPYTGLSTIDAGRFLTDYTSIGWAEYLIGSTSYIVANEVTGSVGDTNRLHFFEIDWNHAATTDIDLGTTGLPDLVFLDGYLFAAGGPSTQRIYNSSIGDPTVWNTGTDFLDAEQFADTIAGLAKHHNHLVVFGNNSIEFFYNAANEIGSPLQRQSSYAISMGSARDGADGPKAKIVVGDVIYFVGMREGVCLGIFKLEGFKITKISPDWMDLLFARGTTAGVGQIVFAPGLRACKFFGKDGFLLNFHAPVSLDTYFYDPVSSVWSKISAHATLSGDHTVNTPYGTVFGASNATNPTYSPIYLSVDSQYQLSGEPDGTSTVASTWKSPPLEFDVTNDKHFYSVEVLGSFPGATVSLSVTEDTLYDGTSSDINAGSKVQTQKTYHGNPLIWRNLGRFRAPRLTVTIVSTAEFRFDGLMIKYNVGNR